MINRYLLDTNVLIPFFSKDFFLELGKRGLPIHWSLPIEAEFLDVWARLFPDKAGSGLKVLQLMRSAVPDWRAPVSRRVLQKVELPDPKDRHVLAAAIGVRADTIVTWNIKDFPTSVLQNHGLIARTPDAVLCDIFAADQDMFIAAAGAMRARMRNPAMSPSEWLEGVQSGGLRGLAARLRLVSETL